MFKALAFSLSLSSISRWLPKATMLLLCGCLVSCAASHGEPETSQPAPAANAAPAARLDACALLPSAAVEKILGQAVTSTNLGRVTEGTQTLAAFSQCTYQCAYQGGLAPTVELFARRSPIADNTAEAIQKVRDTMKEITQKDVADVAGVGDVAFWTAAKQLHVFQGNNLYLYVSMLNFKNDTDAKTKALELARQALAKLNS